MASGASTPRKIGSPDGRSGRPAEKKVADWSNPEPFHLKALHEALLFAYPTAADLNNLFVLHLGQAYNQLAPAGESYRNGLTAVLLQARGEGWLAEWVRQARLDKPRSPKLLLLNRTLELTSAPLPDSLGRNLEDIVRADGGFQDLIPWVEKLEALAHRTCRIECPVNTACGTGWLVGPDLLLTNWHVIEDALSDAAIAKEYVCRFDYAVTAAGTRPGVEVRFAQNWCVDSSPPSSAELGTGVDSPSADTLDYALIRLDTAVGGTNAPSGTKRGWVTLTPTQVIPRERDIIFVIQHPDGLPVKLAPGDIEGFTVDRLRLFHTANTMGGSSGSMVVDARLEPIALHHAGDLLYPRGNLGAPRRNQAVPIGLIIQFLMGRGHLN
jgi:hypothetical protein